MADKTLASILDRSASLAFAELAQLALEELPYGALVADGRGTIRLVNREVERQFGYARHELVGRPVEMLLPPALRADHVGHRATFLSQPRTRAMGAGRRLTGLRRDSSEFPLDVALTPLRCGGEILVLGLLDDLSEPARLGRSRHRTLNEELDFERLLAERAIQFINLAADEVDDAIRDALRQVVLAFDIDRGTVLEIRENTELWYPVSWTRPGLPTPPASVNARERYPWSIARIQRGETVCFSSRDEVGDPIDRASFEAFGIRSALVIPLSVAGKVEGLVNFATLHGERTWSVEVVSRARLVASVLATVLARRRADSALRDAVAEVARLRDRLQDENVYLRSEVRDLRGSAKVIGVSPAVRKLLAQVHQVAATDASVLLVGETGTGKERLAEQIHELSGRRARPMVRVSCASLPSTLLESELFGREKGAYTGAHATQVGRFELADGSTFFLDEVGDLPMEAQVKLLRVLEQKQIERLGSPRSIRVDTRIIAATHRDLEQLVAEGTFRQDLYYRLNVFPIRVPPLRERPDDIPDLVWHFVDEFSTSFHKRITAIPKDNMAALQRYAWPGNVRELRNVVERAVIVATGPQLTITLPIAPAAAQKPGVKLTEVEREHIRRVLDGTHWRIRGPGGAAEQLGMKPTTLETRMAKLGLTRSG
jgi:PAS domain S-box-containing protein